MGNCLLRNIYSIYYIVFILFFPNLITLTGLNLDGGPVVVDVAGTNRRHSLAATQQTRHELEHDIRTM